MSEMTMREKLARAIAAAAWRNDIDEEEEPDRWQAAADAYDLTNNSGRWGFDQIADAVLDVLAEPDERMIDAGVRVHKAGQSPRNVFVEMIDAARSPAKEY